MHVDFTSISDPECSVVTVVKIEKLSFFFSKFFTQLSKSKISFALKTVENKKQNC